MEKPTDDKTIIQSYEDSYGEIHQRTYMAMQRLIGKLFFDARKERKMSLRDLSSQTNIGLAVLSDIENGNRLPKLETILKLAIVLEIPLMDIFSPSIVPAYCKDTYSPINKDKDNPRISGYNVIIDKLLTSDKFNKEDIDDVIDYMHFKLLKKYNMDVNKLIQNI